MLRFTQHEREKTFDTNELCWVKKNGHFQAELQKCACMEIDSNEIFLTLINNPQIWH